MKQSIVFCWVMFGLAGCAVPDKPAPMRPHIILVMADDMGWGDVGYRGHPHLKTPHLDAMAANGLRFDRFYAAGPVCSPTRGSVLTGRHPYRYGVYTANSGKLPEEEITLAEILSDAGYQTGFFGKWHLGTLTSEKKDSNRGGPETPQLFNPPGRHGFDVSFATEAKVPTFDPMWRPANAPASWWYPVRDTSNAVRYGTAYWDTLGEEVTDNMEGDDSRIIMDRTLDFIRQASVKEAPFFAVVWFHAPHLPVVAGPQHTALYHDLDPYSQHYFGSISAIDDQMGRLRDALHELGEAENTMLWFTSDNGPEGQAGDLPAPNPHDGAHMGAAGFRPVSAVAPGTAGILRGRKRDLYEGGVRVPGLLEWPAALPQGRTTSTMAVTSDYLPTIVELLDLPYPDDRPLDGVSIAPLIEGKDAIPDRAIGFEFGQSAAWMTSRLKLVAPAGIEKDMVLLDATRFELYDVEHDAQEQDDLAQQLPDSVEALARRLVQWRASLRESQAGNDYDL